MWLAESQCTYWIEPSRSSSVSCAPPASNTPTAIGGSAVATGKVIATLPGLPIRGNWCIPAVRASVPLPLGSALGKPRPSVRALCALLHTSSGRLPHTYLVCFWQRREILYGESSVSWYCQVSSPFCRILRSSLSMGFGWLVLTGWAFHIQGIKTIVPGQVVIKANTGVCINTHFCC